MWHSFSKLQFMISWRSGIGNNGLKGHFYAKLWFGGMPELIVLTIILLPKALMPYQ